MNEQGEDKPTYQITLNTGESFSTRAIIVATGAKWRKLNIKGEDENIGSGVAYCPHCDGPFFKGKDVAVVGGGNSGIEAAIDLAGIVKHVTVLEFADTLKADQVLINKAKERDNIDIMTSVASQEVKATDGKVSSLIYQDVPPVKTKNCHYLLSLCKSDWCQTRNWSKIWYRWPNLVKLKSMRNAKPINPEFCLWWCDYCTV